MHIYTCRLGHRHDHFLKQFSSSCCALSTCPRLRLDVDTPAVPPHTYLQYTILRCCRAHMVCECPRLFVGVTCSISLCTSFPGRSSFPRTQTAFDYLIEKHTQQRLIHTCHATIPASLLSCASCKNESRRQEATQRGPDYHSSPVTYGSESTASSIFSFFMQPSSVASEHAARRFVMPTNGASSSGLVDAEGGAGRTCSQSLF